MEDNNYIGQTFDLNKLYQKLYGYVAPVFPAIGSFGDQVLPSSPLGVIKGLAEQYKKNLIGRPMLMPLTLEIPTKLTWEVPTEPMISISGKHRIIKRYPNRSNFGGSIKERWSSDDFSITIKGVLVNFKEERYPEDQVKKLREVCQHKGVIHVENTLCRIFGIRQMVIERFEIPFTQGIHLQSYHISGYSDQLFDNLLIES